MRHFSKARFQIGRDAKQVSTKLQDGTPHISDAIRSWVKNVIVPALVRAYLAEQALSKGEVRA
jgi:hypothetical protein